MMNFLEFINEDIEAKKTLLSTMPTKNKRDIKKYNLKLEEIRNRYFEYQKAVKKYIDIKSKSFDIKDDDKDIDKLHAKVTNLEHVCFILNPTNTYFEKIGFDNLLYQISNYYNFNFNTLNDIINGFLDKFSEAGIRLNSDDFDYTCYVNEYMKAFMDVRNKKVNGYDYVSEIFESIYWVNPEIIQHIELNFRKLIKKYEKKFIDYLEKIQISVKVQNKIIDYNDALDKLKEAFDILQKNECEDIRCIISLAKSGEIDINNYFEDSKVRNSNYSTLSIDSLNFSDLSIMENFYNNLNKLKENIEEYSSYLKFLPIFNDFKKEYEKQLPSENTDKVISKDLQNIEAKIKEKEGKLEKISKKSLGGEIKLFGFNNDNSLKKSKIESIKLAKELYELYKIYDQEYFKSKVLKSLHNSNTIDDLLHLYYSFDYFKKIVIKKVFDLTTYDEILKYSEDFDIFAMNPNNVVINGISVFEENDVARVIINKYRLANINLSADNLIDTELSSLLEKIKFVLRIDEIEKSKITIEKIWFMAQVAKINRNIEKNKS